MHHERNISTQSDQPLFKYPTAPAFTSTLQISIFQTSYSTKNHHRSFCQAKTNRSLQFLKRKQHQIFSSALAWSHRWIKPININTFRVGFTSGLASDDQGDFPRQLRRAFSVVFVFILPSSHQTLIPQPAQLGSEQALVAQPNALREGFCPEKRSRPPTSSRSILQESPLVSAPDPGDGPGKRPRPPGAQVAANPARHPALRTPRSAHRTPVDSAQHSTPRAPHPRIPRISPRARQPRIPHRTPHPAHPAPHPAHPAPHSAPRSARPLPARLRRAPPGANGRLRTGFPCGSSVLSRLPFLTHPGTFLGPRKGRRSPPGPGQPRPAEGPGERPRGWVSGLSPRNSTTIAHHRGVCPLKGAPYCSPLHLAELLTIFFLLFPGSSLPQLASVVEGFRHSLGAALPGASLPTVSGRRTGLRCLTPRPCSRGGPCAAGGGHMRISRLEPMIRRVPRALIPGTPATGDTKPSVAFYLQAPVNLSSPCIQLVSFNALLFRLNENLSLF